MSNKNINQEKNSSTTLTNQELYALVNNPIFNGLRTKEERRLAIKNAAKLAFARFTIDIIESPACKALLAVLREFNDGLRKEWQEKMIETHGEDGFKKMDKKIQNDLYAAYFSANAARVEAMLSLESEALTVDRREIKEEDIDYTLLLPIEVEFLLKYFSFRN